MQPSGFYFYLIKIKDYIILLVMFACGNFTILQHLRLFQDTLKSCKEPNGK